MGCAVTSQLSLTVREAISWFSASLVAAAVPTAPMCIGSLPSLVSTGHALLSWGLVNHDDHGAAAASNHVWHVALQDFRCYVRHLTYLCNFS